MIKVDEASKLVGSGYVRSANIKRISSIAAGAALLGAAFGAAQVMVDGDLGNYPFFSNGEPNVKIVVGSTAHPSDAVAAANIAAMIGNLAYTSRSIEVDTSGLTCVGGSTGSGTSTVKLETTTPGVNPNLAYAFQSYLEDAVDQFSDNALGDVNAAGWSAYNGGTGNTTDAKVITQDTTNVLKLTNNGAIQAKSLSIKEEQKIYVYSQTTYDESDKRVETRRTRLMYETSFSNPIPVCLDITKNSITCTSSDELVENRIKIDFLGGQWLISGYTLSGANFQSVSLGKEVQYNEFMQIGDELTAPNGVRLVLTDISGVPTGSNYQPPVSFDIYNAAGQKIDTATLQEGGVSTYDENGVVITLYKAFTGLGQNNYAKVAIFSDRVTLTEGQRVSSSSVPTTNNWYVDLTSTNYSTSQALQKIQIYNLVDTNELKAGDSLTLIPGLSGYKLNFVGFGKDASGTPLENAQWDTLTFSVQKGQTLPIDSSGGTVVGDLLQVTSGRSNAFQFESGAVSTNTVYMVLHTQSVQSTALNGSVLYFKSGEGFYKAGTNHSLQYYYNSAESANITINGTRARSASATQWWGLVPGIDVPGAVKIGTDTSKMDYVIQVPHFITDNGGSTVAQPHHIVGTGGIDSATGLLNGSANQFGITNTTNDWLFIYDSANQQFSNDGSTSTADRVYYRKAFGRNYTAVESGYWNWHGDYVSSIGSSSVSFMVADKILHSKYTLTAGEVSGTANTETKDYRAGETALDSDGYIVKVIDINSGAGGAGGSVSGTPVLSDDTAFVVTELNSRSTPLVVFDSNADTTQPLIVVGGPVVNSVTRQVLGSDVLNAGSQPFVKVMDNKWIFVAGYTKEGTVSAANELIGWLSDNRDVITG
ncbi:S-layer protein [Candidatus Micrarchaeota archaeon]|nr:S-layer protein [Candidatus Micrarchaeota archaeon]